MPMTAALGGRFGGRMASASTHLSRYIPEEPEEYAAQMPPTPGSTNVIAGGTYLCNSTSNNVNVTPNALPSRSDQVSNWRRPGNNVGVSHRAVSSPAVRITPPLSEHQRISPPPGITVRYRRGRHLIVGEIVQHFLPYYSTIFIIIYKSRISALAARGSDKETL